MRASSSELAIWRQRIGDREREHRSFGSIELEVFGALEAERWHALDYEARVREMAADRRELANAADLRALSAFPARYVMGATSMTDDLRDQLAHILGKAIVQASEDSADYDVTNRSSAALQGRFDLTAVADALLARFAVAGPLPDPDTRYHYPNADRWISDPNSPIVYLASNGQIDFAGPGYWNTRKGDDPRLFAAALIAAWRKAQEQHHE